MRKLFFLICFLIMPIILWAGQAKEMVGIAKGIAFDGGVLFVDSFTATVFISTHAGQSNSYIEYDWLLSNDGLYGVFVDSHSTVNTNITSANQGYLLKSGSTLSIDGKCDADIWLKSLTARCTVYYIKVKSTK